MKKKFILFLTTVAMLSSCDSFLETNPVNFINPEMYYTDKASLDAGLMGIYANLTTRVQGNTIYGESNMIFTLTMSDLEYARSSAALYAPAWFNFTSSHSQVAEYWNALYQCIQRANAFIGYIEPLNLPDVNDEYKTAALGEAYALRGFCYWHLAANFGGVPLRTTFEIYPHMERASLKDTYEQVLSDLKKAEGMVFDADQFSHAGRITKTTVQALLARACLYMAGKPLEETGKYGEAVDWARKVVQSGLHKLNTTTNADGVNMGYEDFFTRLIRSEYDTDYRESMWEAEFAGVDGDTPRTNGQWGSMNGIYCIDLNIGYSSPQVQPSRLLENYYLEDSGDKRYVWSVAPHYWGTTDPGTYTNQSIEFRYVGKYRKEADLRPKTRNYTHTNFPIMRYADVLLMLAEAINEVDGPTDEAIDALNEVRSRAEARECANFADPDKIVLYDQDEFREFIKKERARELCFEATRRLDLVRWGHLVESVKYMTSIASASLARRQGNNIEEKHNLLPIPASEVNSNNLMTQNQGW